MSEFLGREHIRNEIDSLTAEIVAAYVSKNAVPASDLPALIQSVRTALTGNSEPAAAPQVEVQKPTPAEIKKSITPDALISFIDGKPYKSMRRHLTANGLTPEGYRARYSLPADYPLVSANYSQQRSALAKSLGLGQPRPVAAKRAAKDATKSKKA